MTEEGDIPENDNNPLSPAVAGTPGPVAFSGKSVINIPPQTVTRGTAHLPEEQRLLLRWAYDYAKENEWSWKEATEQLKVSSTVLYRVWSDKYRQPPTIRGKELENGTFERVENPRAGERIPVDGVCREIERAKALLEARNTAVTALPFVETSTWRKIDHFCREVLISQTIGIVFGESQIGKTRCFEEYRRRNNHGQTAHVDVGGDRVLGHCMDIAHELHIGRSSFDKMFRSICDTLDGSRLLILDDVHVIFECYQRGSIARCLTFIRKIHDRTKCGLVLSCTEVFATEAARSEFKNTMKQFFRRGVLRLQLGVEPPWADIVAIAAHYKLPPPKGDVETALREIARNDGLGKITKYLAGAARKAAKDKRPFNWSHFERYLDITTRMAAPIAKH